jgi:hypothetical protein
MRASDSSLGQFQVFMSCIGAAVQLVYTMVGMLVNDTLLFGNV